AAVREAEAEAEAEARERAEAKEVDLLRKLAVGLHPVLLVEPLTTVREVTKWYTVQLEKSFKSYRHRRKKEKQAALEAR
ncbi:unnamed protein product, partial [Ectocarpus sp. 6 AP-2014]